VSPFILGFVVAFLPAVASACAVCIGGNEANREAFIFTTILLTIIPLIVIGCSVRWIQKRCAERDAQLEATKLELR
jgi:hypothetical protein